MARLANIHPGEVLREDFMKPLNLSAYELAKQLGEKQTTIGEILAGKRAVTPRTALLLARYFGTSAQFWLNLQAAFNLEEEQQRMSDRLQRIRPREAVPA